MKNEDSTPHLSANGTRYIPYCLLVCSPKGNVQVNHQSARAKWNEDCAYLWRRELFQCPPLKPSAGFYLLFSPQIPPAEDQPWNLQDRDLHCKDSLTIWVGHLDLDSQCVEKVQPPLWKHWDIFPRWTSLCTLRPLRIQGTLSLRNICPAEVLIIWLWAWSNLSEVDGFSSDLLQYNELRIWTSVLYCVDFD